MIYVILPTFKTWELTIRCIEALEMAQTMQQWRLVWIDDGSTLDGVEKVKEYLRENLIEFIHTRHERNRGYAAAINTGLGLVSHKEDAEGFVLINNDVIVADNWLDWLVRAMHESGAGIVGAVTENISGACKRYASPEYSGNLFVPVTSGNVAFFCVLISPLSLRGTGLLDESFRNGGEDDDWNDRTRAAGFTTAVCPKCRVGHDWHGTFGTMADWPEDRIRNRELLREKREQRSNDDA